MCIATIVLILSGCKEDKSVSVLEGCCDIPAISTTIGNGHIYVANIITSNADGINDIVWPWTDDYIIIIERFQIKNNQGEIVYEVFDESPNDSSKGWDGRTDGQWIEGVYDVLVEAQSADGTTGIVEGKVCNFRCQGAETSETISADGCQFPSQVNNGLFDPTVPSGEPNDCFE